MGNRSCRQFYGKMWPEALSNKLLNKHVPMTSSRSGRQSQFVAFSLSGTGEIIDDKNTFCLNSFSYK